MIGLDSNVLVLYFMQDAKKAAKANTLIESLSADKPGFISLIALVELVWVLDCCFQLRVINWCKRWTRSCLPRNALSIVPTR